LDLLADIFGQFGSLPNEAKRSLAKTLRYPEEEEGIMLTVLH
jgi:hypothetical protein